MLLEYIDPFFSLDVDTGTNILTKYTRYITNLTVRKTLIEARHSAHPGTESDGIRLLKHILNIIDIEYLKKCDDDFARYNNYFRYVDRDLKNIFDPNATGNEYKKMFFDKGMMFDTIEYIIPVSCENPIEVLPLGDPPYDWLSMRPVRIIDHDSDEYTMNILMDKVKFKVLSPSYAVITIDPVMLGFMWFKYLELNEFDPNLTPQAFLHDEVMIKLMSDLQDIWLRNQIINLFDIDKEEDITNQPLLSSVFDNQYGYIGLQYREAMLSIWKVIQQIKSGKIKPEVFLRSIQLTRHSLSSYLTDLLSQTYIPLLRQYTWQRYLRDMHWMELVLKVYNTNPKHITTQNLNKILHRKNNNLARTRFWSNIHSRTIRTQIEDHFNRISKDI